MNSKVISLNAGIQLKDAVRSVKAIEVPVDSKVVDYLHRAAGKHCLMLSDVSINRVERWVKSDITTVAQMVEAHAHELRQELPTIYSNGGPNYQVPVHQFILAFGFPNITIGNAREYATGIYHYLLSGNEACLSQLKGKRKKEFLASVEKIADAKALISKMSNSSSANGYLLI